jgi:hypothetical protein
MGDAGRTTGRVAWWWPPGPTFIGGAGVASEGPWEYSLEITKRGTAMWF